jgi:hypothetical protein
MSRIIKGLALGGVLLLFTAACSQGSTVESSPAETENLEASSSEAGNTDAQNPEAEGKPIVTVSRSPT